MCAKSNHSRYYQRLSGKSQRVIMANDSRKSNRGIPLSMTDYQISISELNKFEVLDDSYLVLASC